MLHIIGGIVALLVGIYIGLGWPGLTFGRKDRVLPNGMRRRRKDHFTPIDMLRKRDRHRP